MKLWRKNSTQITLVGSLVVALILVFGTVLTGQSAQHDTDRAVRTVSLLYLDELAGRREQVVENNLRQRIDDIQVALDLLSEEDLLDMAHLKDIELRVCYLLKMEVQPSDIGPMVGRVKSTISMMCSRIYLKLTQQQGSSKDLTRLLQTL